MKGTLLAHNDCRDSTVAALEAHGCYEPMRQELREWTGDDADHLVSWGPATEVDAATCFAASRSRRAGIPGRIRLAPAAPPGPVGAGRDASVRPVRLGPGQPRPVDVAQGGRLASRPALFAADYLPADRRRPGLSPGTGRRPGHPLQDVLHFHIYLYDRFRHGLLSGRDHPCRCG